MRRPPEKYIMASLASDVEVELNELKLKLKSGAVDHSYLRNEGHLDSISAFISSYRSTNDLRVRLSTRQNVPQMQESEPYD